VIIFFAVKIVTGSLCAIEVVANMTEHVVLISARRRVVIVLLLYLGQALDIFCESNITGSRQIAAYAESEAYDRKTMNGDKLSEARFVEHAFVITRLSAHSGPTIFNPSAS
jgi:hypothetical protein